MANEPIPEEPKSWRELFSRMTPVMWRRFALLAVIVLAGVAVIVAALTTGVIDTIESIDD